MICFSIRAGPPCRQDAFGGKQILRAPRDAVERTFVSSRPNLFVGLRCLCQREILGERHDVVQLRADSLEPIEIHLRQLCRADVAPSQKRCERGHGHEGEVLDARSGVREPETRL